MPIYEYHCQKCDKEFERLVRSAREKIACPACTSRLVKRKPSLFATSGSTEGASDLPTGSSCASCRATSCAGCRK